MKVWSCLPLAASHRIVVPFLDPVTTSLPSLAQGHAGDRGGVPGESLELHAASSFPEDNRVASCTSDQELAISAEGHTFGNVDELLEVLELRAAGASHKIAIARSDTVTTCLTVAAHGHAFHFAGVPREGLELLTADRLPQDRLSRPSPR